MHVPSIYIVYLCVPQVYVFHLSIPCSWSGTLQKWVQTLKEHPVQLRKESCNRWRDKCCRMSKTGFPKKRWDFRWVLKCHLIAVHCLSEYMAIQYPSSLLALWFSSASPLIPLIYLIYHSVCSWGVHMSQSGPREWCVGLSWNCWKQRLFLLDITSEGCQHRPPEETQETETSRWGDERHLTYHGAWSRHSQAMLDFGLFSYPSKQNQSNLSEIFLNRTLKDKDIRCAEQTLSTASREKLMQTLI